MKYFEHYTNDRGSIAAKLIKRKLGAKGYGIYISLLEVIGENVKPSNIEDWGHVDKLHDIESLAEECAVSIQEMKEFLEYCDKKEIFEKHDGRLYCSLILERLDCYANKIRQSRTKSDKVASNRIEENRVEQNKNNGKQEIASPVVKTFQEAKEAIAQKLSFPRSGISTAWQEKAFRYADTLKIKLDDDLKARWLKIFKESTLNGQKAKNLEQAYSYLVDYFPFQSLGAKEKILYFFKLYNDGVQKQGYSSGYVSLKALIFGVLCTSLILLSPVLAKQPDVTKTTIEIGYTVKSQYVTTGSAESDIPLISKKKVVLRPTPGSLPKITPRNEVEKLICKYFGSDCNMAIAIAKAESGLNCSSIGDGHINPHSYGVFQIRGLAGRPLPDQLLDCEVNIAWAYKMFKTQGWNPWSVYTNGRYQLFLNK